MGTDWLRSLNFIQLNDCNRLQNDYCSSTHVTDCLPGDWTGVSLVVSCHGRVLDQWLHSPAASLWCPSLRLADWSQTVGHHPWACSQRNNHNDHSFEHTFTVVIIKISFYVCLLKYPPVRHKYCSSLVDISLNPVPLLLDRAQTILVVPVCVLF